MGKKSQDHQADLLRRRVRQMIEAGYSIARMARETGKSVAHITRIAAQERAEAGNE